MVNLSETKIVKAVATLGFSLHKTKIKRMLAAVYHQLMIKQVEVAFKQHTFCVLVLLRNVTVTISFV